MCEWSIFWDKKTFVARKWGDISDKWAEIHENRGVFFQPFSAMFWKEGNS
jgi:hypothetical protein